MSDTKKNTKNNNMVGVYPLDNGKDHKELLPLQNALKLSEKLTNQQGWLHKDVLAEIAKIDPTIAQSMADRAQITSKQVEALLEKVKMQPQEKQTQEQEKKPSGEPQLYILRMSTFGIIMSIVSALLFLGILLALVFGRKSTA
jgi:hypothetical protein